MLVFFRIGVIFLVRVNLVYSGFLCYIFIMIFIGGLMVLLVSVASTVPQEQGVSFIPYLVSLIIINLFLWVWIKMDIRLGINCRETSINLLNLIDSPKFRITILLLLILVVCLFIVTKLILEYKGLTRNLG